MAHDRFHSAVRALIRAFACTGCLIAAAPAFAHNTGASTEAVAEPWIAATLAIAGALYVRGLYVMYRASGGTPTGVRRSAVLFALGWLTLVLALASPLAAATEGLFSAHMAQHELLMVVAAPLMVLGRPLAIWTWALPEAWRPAAARPFRGSGVSAAWRFASAPLAATVLHGLAIWLWHVPALFESAEESVAMHALQHTAFLGSALLFWWALLKPGRNSAAGAAVLYFFLTMLHTGALGVLLTFSGDVWYPASTAGAHRWGLTPVEDQQLGGLIMWVIGGTPYVVAALAIAARWFAADRAAAPVLR
jgi:putative membrane protein